jgi:hypothetical protein
MSGYPFQNNLGELYTMVQFARPQASIFGNYREFQYR